MRVFSLRELPRWEEVMSFWDWLGSLYATNQLRWRDYVFFALLIHYGRRLTELSELKINDVDIKNNVIWFKQLKSRKKEDERPHHIIAKLKVILDEYVTFYRQIGQEKMFEVTSRQLRNVCYKYTKMFFERELPPHAFRSVLITWINRNANIAVSKEFIGHKNIATTQRYTRLTKEDIRKSLPEDLQ